MSSVSNPPPLASNELVWSDALILGFPEMDAEHREFVELVGAMQGSADDQLPAVLEAFAEHARAHFGQEDQWMRETGFPARDCHIDEHAAVLKSVRLAKARLAAGDSAACHRLGEELARWFPGHADYLDSALAHWMCKRRFGGKPVVLRRGALGR